MHVSKKKILNRCVGILSVLVFCMVFFLLQRLVTPKYADGILEGSFTAEYYKESTKHDVIMIGDCEVYENFDTMYLWENYGITSYIRGNAQQLTWQSYYMLEDTLRHEKPKLVVYNIQALTHAVPQKEEYNRMTLDGMKWSKTKLDAIKASACEGEKMADYLFPILRYHSRITDLNKNDITYFGDTPKNTHNGYYMRIDVLPASESDVADTSWLLGEEEAAVEEEEEDEFEDPWAEIEVPEEEEAAPVEKERTEGDDFGELPLEYLERMSKLCEKEGIQLLLIKAPSLAPEWFDTDEEQVCAFAGKHGLPYINFYELLTETGIDYETDTYDGGLHMNRSGACKLAGYLGEVLQKEYGIKDHRKDAKIAKVYDKKLKEYKSAIKDQQEQLEKYGEILYP